MNIPLKKGLVIIIILLFLLKISLAVQTIKIDDANYLAFYEIGDEPVGGYQPYSNFKEGAYSESYAPKSNTPDPIKGSIESFNGKKFGICLKGDDKIKIFLDSNSMYDYSIKIDNNKGGMQAKSNGYLRVLEKNGKRWEVVDPWLVPPLETKILSIKNEKPWSFDYQKLENPMADDILYEDKSYVQGVKIPEDGTSELECGKQYVAGVSAFTEVDLPQSGHGAEIDALSKIVIPSSSKDSLFGLKIELPEKYACGVPAEDHSTATFCKKNEDCTISLSASYIELKIPANALDGSFSFFNSNIDSGEIITIYKSERNQIGYVSPVYYVLPSDLLLNIPATLTIEYDENLINNEDNLFIARFDNENLIKLKTESIDKENDRIIAKTSKLGDFVVVEDNTPPIIGLEADPNTLWPPNDKQVDVTINGFVVDTTSGVDQNSLKLSINNEKKEFSIDRYGGFSITLPLIAKRSGKDKEGYKYNIELTALDNFGNTNKKSIIVLVPHDQKR